MALKKNLDECKKIAQSEVDAAETDITRAKEYINEHDKDVADSLWSDVCVVGENLLRLVKTELAKEKPNYIMIVKVAKEANGTADTILESAKTEYETAEKLRRDIKSTRIEAMASISKAKEYIDDHGNDVSRTAKEHLERAHAALANASGENELQSKAQLQDLKTADSEADKEYDRAKKDFSNAEDERDRERRRATDLAISSARRRNSSYSSSSSWGSSSRSSSSMGGGFGGGSEAGVMGLSAVALGSAIVAAAK